MLSVFRSFTRSKIGAFIAFLVLGVIAAAFILGDITGGQFGARAGGGDVVAKVNGARLTAADLQDRAQRVFDNARRSNPGLQMSDFLTQGGLAQVYDQLVGAMAIDEYAADQNVHISKRLVDAQIAQIPAFQDAAGKFSQENFRQLLIRERLTEQALRADITREILERQLLRPAGLGASVSDSVVLPYASLLLEARQGTVAAIPAVAFLSDKDPTDAQLADFYKRDAARFTIPEQRRIRYAIIDAERFAQAAQPTDAEIAGYYESNKARYAARETRDVEQLVLPTEAAAKAIADKVKAGTSLAAAAREAGLSSSTLSDQTRAALTGTASQAVADAAFSTARGTVAGPVRGALGWVVLRVTAIKETPARALAAVRPEITAALREQKEKRLLSEFTGKIQDQIADGASFEEVAKDNGLKPELTAPLLSSGRQVENSAAEPGADVQPLLAPVFGMSADDDPQLVPIAADKRYALAAPGDIIAAAPPPLEKVKPIVQAQYKLNEGNQKAKAMAAQIQAKVAKGTKLADAIAAAGVKLPAPQVLGGRRADILNGQQRPPAEVAILFAMAEKSVRTLPIGEDRGYFVVQLNVIERGDAAKEPALLTQVRSQLGDVVGVEYGQQLTRAMEKQLGVKRYPQAVAAVGRALATPDAAQ